MYMENQSEQFIRLLTEALEADRSIRKSRTAGRYKASAERFRQLFQSEQDDPSHRPHSMSRALDHRVPQSHEPLFL